MILQRLKQATTSRHRALESQLPLMRDDLTRSSYHALLRLFFGYYAPLEARMMALPFWPAVGFDYSTRFKTPLLVQDALALGDSPEAVAGYARCHKLPALSNPAQVWGCLYVIEGATLGGQLITKQISATAGVSHASGASFFDGYGSKTGSHWKTFCAQIEARALQSGGHDDMVASAQQTFETLGKWLFKPAPVAHAAHAAQNQTIDHALNQNHREEHQLASTLPP